MAYNLPIDLRGYGANEPESAYIPPPFIPPSFKREKPIIGPKKIFIPVPSSQSQQDIAQAHNQIRVLQQKLQEKEAELKQRENITKQLIKNIDEMERKVESMVIGATTKLNHCTDELSVNKRKTTKCESKLSESQHEAATLRASMAKCQAELAVDREKFQPCTSEQTDDGASGESSDTTSGDGTSSEYASEETSDAMPEEDNTVVSLLRNPVNYASQPFKIGSVRPLGRPTKFRKHHRSHLTTVTTPEQKEKPISI